VTPRTRRVPRVPRCPRPAPIVAIVGRPNVGKSTLFNRYAGFRRALVQDEPGVTRDSIAEELELPGGRRILLVDTAGLDPDAEGELPAAVQAQAIPRAPTRSSTSSTARQASAADGDARTAPLSDRLLW
jgi:tRNA U34 5-carboxymethylaminomethyl modifying GTPase MnmE/TrmE